MAPTEGVQESEQLAERLFASGLAAFELLCVYLGQRLGLYEAMATGRTMTPSELSTAAGIAGRYAREWLEQQAAAGIVLVVSDDEGPDRRSYRLPESATAVLVDPESLLFSAPFGDLLVCVAKPIDHLTDAFRSGGGVHHSQYEPEHRRGQGAFSRPAFIHQLGSEWMPKGLPDVHERLRTHPPARVAEIGCGLGWAAIGLATDYPSIRVHGFDLDEPSIVEARQNAVDANLSDRVTFSVHDATDPALAGSYDLVCMFEVLHDVARPVDLLHTARRLLAPGGAVLIVDERVAERFAAPGDEVERFMYACSVLHCLPIALAETPSAATGTVMRCETVDRYAQAAGFEAADVLPIDNGFFQFYRLR